MDLEDLIILHRLSQVDQVEEVGVAVLLQAEVAETPFLAVELVLQLQGVAVELFLHRCSLNSQMS